MMKPGVAKHLTDDELLKKLVDGEALSHDRRSHLQVCSHCQRQADDLALRFDRLGLMARKMAPEPARVFRLPEAGAGLWRWPVRTALAMGGVVVLVVAVIFLKPDRLTPVPEPPPMTNAAIRADEQLMARVDELVTDALPKSYQKLVAVSDPILTEELIDWIVPPIEEDNSRSKSLLKKQA
jgi:hypothetical protein